MKSSRPRNIANLSDSNLHRPDLHDLGATVARMQMVAVGQPAEAKIGNTKARHVIKLNGLLNPRKLSNPANRSGTLCQTPRGSQTSCKVGWSQWVDATLSSDPHSLKTKAKSAG